MSVFIMHGFLLLLAAFGMESRAVAGDCESVVVNGKTYYSCRNACEPEKITYSCECKVMNSNLEGDHTVELLQYGTNHSTGKSELLGSLGKFHGRNYNSSLAMQYCYREGERKALLCPNLQR